MMKRLRQWPTALGVLAVVLLLIGGASRATAAPEPVRVVQAQIVEEMFDKSGQAVRATPGKQFVMVEVTGLVRADELTLNGVTPMAVVDNRFVFEVDDTREMIFAYRPAGGAAW